MKWRIDGTSTFIIKTFGSVVRLTCEDLGSLEKNADLNGFLQEKKSYVERGGINSITFVFENANTRELKNSIRGEGFEVEDVEVIPQRSRSGWYS